MRNVRSKIFRLAAFYGAITSVVALAEAPAPSLHARIVAQYDGQPDADPAAEMRSVRLLVDAVAIDPAATLEDHARVKMLLGLAFFHQRAYGEAVRETDVACAALEQAGQGDSALAIEIAMNAALFYGETGDRAGAELRLEQVKARQTRKFGAESNEVAATLGMIAYNALHQGRVDYAITTMRAAIAGMRPDPSSIAAWIGYHNTLTTALAAAGRQAEQLQLARLTLDLARKNLSPRHRGIAVAFANLSVALDDAGRFTEGEAVARQAVDLNIQYRGRNNPDTASAMRDLAANLSGQGRAEEAEAVLLAGRDIYVAVADTAVPAEAAGMVMSAAESARSRGDNKTADARTIEALALLGAHAKDYRALRVRANTDRALGLLLGGRPADALPFARLASDGTGELSLTHPTRAAATMLYGVVLARLGRANEGLAAALPVEQALDASIISASARTGELFDFGPAFAISFTRFAEIALAADRADLAFRAAQLADLSSLAITNRAVAARNATGDPEAAKLARQIQDVAVSRGRLDRERSFALSKSTAEVARLDGAITALDVRAAAIGVALNASFPQYRILSSPMPATLADTMASLNPSQVLLVPLFADDGLVSMAVSKRGLTWHRDNLHLPAASAAIAAIRASMELPGGAISFPAGQAYRLYRALFPPAIAAALPRHADLILFGGGALARLPIGLLVTRPPARPVFRAADMRLAPWLIKSHSIEIATTLSGSAATAPAGAGSIGFVGIGAPSLGAAARLDATHRAMLRGGQVTPAVIRSLPSLPGAANELRQIGAAFKPHDSLLLLGDDANKTRIEEADLTRYAVVAFATHGVFAGEGSLSEPALVLTPGIAASTDDGLLTASEASTLRLNADWLILSGCDTAGAGDRSAPVYSGLARAFFQAGARSILVSMWPIRDDLAAKLTVATVRNSRFLSKPRALQEAALTLMNDKSIAGSANPAIWASFTLLER